MYHLNQQRLSLEVRKPHVNKLQQRLMRHVETPILTSDQRALLVQALTKLGRPKVYSEQGSKSPLAINLEPIGSELPEIDFKASTTESLSAYRHQHLVQHAVRMGIDVYVTDSKALVIQKILEHVSQETP
jgi:hypothetical protein